MSLNVIQLLNEERIKTGCSHALRIKVAQLVALALAAGATTSLTVDVSAYQARDIFPIAFFDLVTPFDGGATTDMTMAFGYNGATVDDAAAFISARSVHQDGTEILADAGSVDAVDTSTVDNTYGQAENDVITSLRVRVNQIRGRRWFAAQEAGVTQLVFTSSGANISELTTGEIVIYFNQIRPTDLRGING